MQHLRPHNPIHLRKLSLDTLPPPETSVTFGPQGVTITDRSEDLVDLFGRVAITTAAVVVGVELGRAIIKALKAA